MRGLEGLRVLVTGAAGGIGEAVVERLAEDGARVAASDLAGLVTDRHKAELALAGDVTDEVVARAAKPSLRQAASTAASAITR